jgi:hypothetical protein
MTLTVGVDTYGNLADLEAVLIGLGFVEYLDANDDPTLEAHARSACLFLDHAYAWCGVPAVPGQALAWPRSGALDIDGFEIPDDVVPNEVVTAQGLLMQACSAGPLDGGSGGASDDRQILAEAADDASVTYAPGSGFRKFPMVSALMRHLTTSHLMGSFRQLEVMRG